MFFDVEIKQDTCDWWNYKSNGNKKKKKKKKKSENNVFRSKQKTNGVPTNIIIGVKARKKVRLMFSRPKYIKNGKCYVFSGYKERNNVPFVFLECKLKKDRCGWYFFNLNWSKTIETIYLERRKQQTNDGRRFSMLKSLGKGNNCIIGLCQQTSQVQCMCLALENLKRTSKKIQ